MNVLFLHGDEEKRGNSSGLAIIGKEYVHTYVYRIYLHNLETFAQPSRDVSSRCLEAISRSSLEKWPRTPQSEIHAAVKPVSLGSYLPSLPDMIHCPIETAVPYRSLLRQPRT